MYESVIIALKDIDIAHDGGSSPPAKGTGLKLLLTHRRDRFMLKPRYSVTAEELDWRFFYVFVVRTGALTNVTAPRGVEFAHQFAFGRGELTLPLGYIAQAGCALTGKNTARAGAFARSALHTS